MLALGFSSPALAGVNFTSGKVYMQQKVYDKACHFLELARREEQLIAQRGQNEKNWALGK